MFRLLLGASFIGLAPVFVKLLHLGPTPIAIYRCGFAAVFLFIYLLSSGRFSLRKLPINVWRLLFLAGFLFGLDLFVWHRSVIYAGAGIGTILANTQIFYVALIGMFFYKEKPTFRFVASVFLAFIGIYLLVAFRLASEFHPNYGLGVFFGLLTGIIYASYILTMRRVESQKAHISTESALALISLIAAVILIPVSIGEGSLRLPDGHEFLLLLVLAFIAQVLGWLLITRNLPKTPVSQAGLVLNMQPVVAVLGGALVLQERLSGLQILGAVMTLVAIYLGTKRVRPAIESTL
jgi:drug/metabolite transporter (DMT)-like permease